MSENLQFEQTLAEWVKISMHRSMHAFTRWMTESGLSRSQFGALMTLHYKGACPVTSIGNELGITTAAASQLVEKLVKMGLIARTDDDSDRRVKQVTLIKAGNELIQEGFKARLGWMPKLASALNTKEQHAINESLITLIETTKRIQSEIDVEKE